MSVLSNNHGRAYEFACLMAFAEEIEKVRAVQVVKNKGYEVALAIWNNLDEVLKDTFKKSAKSAVWIIFDMEPLILEGTTDLLKLEIQTDARGVKGDVRDILIVRDDICWEIGLSVKHNHFAVKHSRLSRVNDFGEKWFGVKCSQAYWDAIGPIFDFLSLKQKVALRWEDLKEKENEVYVPVLNAFMQELRMSACRYLYVPKKMVEYLLGLFDFYKVINSDSGRVTWIQTYNMRGTLNKSARHKKPKIVVPQVELPTRIISLDFKENSKNTVELYMDAGWQFSFRIHNASKLVEPSLKFDIQLIGVPASIMQISSHWK